MALMTTHPKSFDLFDDMLDGFFRKPNTERFGVHGAVPSVNISDNLKEYSLEVATPGLKKDDIDINIENDVLTISSEQKHEDETEEDNYTKREFSYSGFSRSFRLPEDIVRDDINASYEDGVLKLTLPKLSEENKKETKKIEIM